MPKRRGTPGAGRPSKGDRRQFVTRVPRAAADLVLAEAEARDLSYSEYLAIVIALAHGVPAAMPDPLYPVARQGELSISA